jgi:hypothetical protein
MPIWSTVARLDDRKRVVICTAKHEYCQSEVTHQLPYACNTLDNRAQAYV